MELHFFQYGTGNCLRQSAATLIRGLLKMLHLFKPLHESFFIALLLEATQCLFKRLVRLDTNFRHANTTSPLQ